FDRLRYFIPRYLEDIIMTFETFWSLLLVVLDSRWRFDSALIRSYHAVLLANRIDRLNYLLDCTFHLVECDDENS
ncbi:23099_t:CDS:1, partial [Racocetra persica]